MNKLFLILATTFVLTACMLPDNKVKQGEMYDITVVEKQRMNLAGQMIDVIEYKGKADMDLSQIGNPSSTLLGATFEWTIAYDKTKEAYFKKNAVDILVVASTQHVGDNSFEGYFLALPQATYKGIKEFGFINISEEFLKSTLVTTNNHFDGKMSTANGGSDAQLVRRQLESVGVLYDHVEFVAPYYPE